ncbi:unnamed protein product [Bursaphelenchus okinawaensis]|uniref:Uncharacterized protein n=1 Tax=Bursaphelenchus okinawaensis TaxID=465554 RepID=A0A811KI00_9BILA|nr:unnamed protein product [Bursaphelenchus okinawaensis]CAG9103419.1 unnamed protein product [Bursaphelenchus okinawaensis]
MLDSQNHQFAETEEESNLLLQKLLNQCPEMADDVSEPQEQAESASTSSKCNETSENGRDTQSPVTVNGDLANELTKQLSFVSHNLVKLLHGLGQKPCSCNDCNKCLLKFSPETASCSRTTTTPHLNLDFVVKNLQRGEHDEVEYLEDGTVKRGRKSKYCTPERKKEVAIYAEEYGATAASKHFRIPPAVAAYYHRKLRATILSEGHGKIKSVASKSDFNGEEVDSEDSPSITTNGFFQSPHLRGRGRGRPKLIGDDLDAELVEHMVGVKRRVPRGHLTASYALEVARGYIMNKQPNLLEENGGPINLKITWAIKLVSRTNERYQELYGNNATSSVDDLLANLGHSNEEAADNVKTATPEIHNVRELDLNFAFNNVDGQHSQDNMDGTPTL